MVMFRVQEENTKEVLEEARPLAESHYYEVEEKGAEVSFNLDISLLYEYMKMGIFFMVTARNWEGELVGYFANLVSPDPITSRPISREFGIYVKPEYRNSQIFTQMVEKVEEGARARKCYSQVLAFKEGHDVGIAQKCGYRPTEQLYQRILEV